MSSNDNEKFISLINNKKNDNVTHHDTTHHDVTHHKVDTTVSNVSADGTKYALLIGINYLSDPYNKLSGCINDVKNVKEMLINKFNYKLENMVILTDDQDATHMPTKQNILDNITKIVANLRKNDVLYIHYSGHGGNVKSTDSDEDNNPDTPGQDDCLYPCDFNDNGIIIDDDLKANLVNKIPQGAKLVCIFDCCHSGSALDLPFLWKRDGEFYNVSSADKQSNDCILISGCKDNQTSSDSWNQERKEAGGALTMMLVKALTNTPTIKTSWKDLILVVRHYLADNYYKQIPMLSVGDKALADENVSL